MLDYQYKDGKDYESYGDEDDLLDGAEAGEEEIEMLRQQLSEEQLNKLKEQGITLEQYLNGAGEELEGFEDLYGEEAGEDDLYGDENAEEGDEAGGAAGDKRAKTD